MKVSLYQDRNFLRKYEARLKARQKICFRKILELLGPLHGKKVLDLGCGPGNLAKIMAEKGAKVIGIDQSLEWIKACNKKYTSYKNLSFIHANGARLKFIKSSSQDIVVMNLVLPNAGSIHEVHSIFREVGRILKNGGVFIFSDIHPILTMSRIAKPDRYQKYSPKFSYFRDGSEFTAGIVLNKKTGENIEFHNKHWKLETYSTYLKQAGLCIETLSEPTYNKGDDPLLRRYKIPEYLLIGCKKMK